jgi:hypothetical protein
MNKPTTIPINTHAFNPKTFVFFDNPEFRSDAILLLSNKSANIGVEKLEGTLIHTTKSYDTKLLNQANLHKQSDQNTISKYTLRFLRLCTHRGLRNLIIHPAIQKFQ